MSRRSNEPRLTNNLSDPEAEADANDPTGDINNRNPRMNHLNQIQNQSILTPAISGDIESLGTGVFESDDDSDDDIVKVPKEFQENVIKFIQYDDLIRTMTAEVAGLKKKRDIHKKYVIDQLEVLGETIIEIDGGKLRRNKFETKQPLTHELIKQAILEKVGNPQVTEEIISLMNDKRPMKERIDLKRTFDRGMKPNPKPKKGGKKPKPKPKK